MPQPRHALLATVALVLGGFAIGTTEFVTMGLLPDIASGISVSIPDAGHAISAYAAGVVVGAPLIAVLGATWPRRELLIGLMVAFVVGNVATALAPDYGWLLLSRFFAGMPHGAFFGVAALVAVDLAARGQHGRAVSRVMLGIPIANVAGVPGATWLGQHLGWQAAYWLVAVLGVLTVGLLVAFVPHIDRDIESTIRRELGDFATTQVALTLLVGAIGFGGMFAMASYIAPTVTDVTGLEASAVPLFLLASGIGGLVGTPLAGRLGEWSVLRSITIGCVGMGATLVAFALTAQWWPTAVFFYFLSSVLAGVLVVNLQLRLMQVAGRAQTLGAASNHAALNLANALGAWLGGVVIAGGYGYTAPSWVGAGLSVLGAGVLGLSLIKHRSDQRARVTAPVGH
ncbi:DHA1 family inner membrane transport protein [Knoellia remsis]|uniref:DHA1 family inner membrane transport protein n=1 Tax=Knoellia remsis TaxID=407159 RepID=A0A2T0UGI0_9MICO|nr:MFS transporter [Knoellia remsis]PRY57012.1 DHA1 family inner membrane transport protein [Knoellia remsis]